MQCGEIAKIETEKIVACLRHSFDNSEEIPRQVLEVH
jgi:hypothetical protein